MIERATRRIAERPSRGGEVTAEVAEVKNAWLEQWMPRLSSDDERALPIATERYRLTSLTGDYTKVAAGLGARTASESSAPLISQPRPSGPARSPWRESQLCSR